MLSLKAGGGCAEQRADPMYNAYMAQQPRNANGNLVDVASELPLQRFRYSQVYCNIELKSFLIILKNFIF